MYEQYPKKPTSLVFIGWFLISVSTLIVLTDLFSLSFKYFGGLDPAAVEDAQIFPEPINTIMVAFWFVYYIFLLVSSIQFLRLRPWARTSLEILTWIYICYTLVFLIWELLPIENKFTNNLYSVLGQFGETFLKFIKVFLFLTSAVYIIAGSFIVKYLRSATIRDAFITSSDSIPPQQVI